MPFTSLMYSYSMCVTGSSMLCTQHVWHWRGHSFTDSSWLAHVRTHAYMLCTACTHTHDSRGTQITGVGHLVVDRKEISRERERERERKRGRARGTQTDWERKAFNEKKKKKREGGGGEKVTADCEGGGDEGSQRRKRQGWMNGWMEEEGQTQRGCGDRCQEKEREDGGKRDRLDGEKKRSRMPGRYERDSLAVRRGVIMADGNHSSDSPPSLSIYIYTHTSD